MNKQERLSRKLGETINLFEYLKENEVFILACWYIGSVLRCLSYFSVCCHSCRAKKGCPKTTRDPFRKIALQPILIFATFPNDLQPFFDRSSQL